MVHRSTDWAREKVIPAHALGRDFSKELTIDTLYRQRGDAVMSDEGVMREKRSEVTPRTWYEFRQHGQEEADTLLSRFGEDQHSDTRYYRLDDEDTYIVQFAERTDVPGGDVGYVAPKESLISMGVQMHGTFVGPEEPRTGALLYLEDKVALLSEDAAVAEFVVWTPDQA